MEYVLYGLLAAWVLWRCYGVCIKMKGKCFKWGLK